MQHGRHTLVGLALGEFQPALEHGDLFLRLFISFHLFQTHTDFALGDLVQRAEITLFAAVFLFQFGEADGGCFQLGLFGFDECLFLGEVAGDDERFWDQVAGPALVFALALLVGFDDACRFGNPSMPPRSSSQDAHKEE